MDATARIYTIKKDVKTLAEEFKARRNLTNEDFSKMINFSRTAVSNYFNGAYPNPKNVEKAIVSLLHAEGEMPEDVQYQKPFESEKSKFYLSTDARQIIGLCQDCQVNSEMGVVCGRTGYGKTYTLKQYAKSDRVSYIECDDTMSSKDLVEAIEESLGLPTIYGTIAKRLKHIREYFIINEGYLLIVDEADKLLNKHTQKKMEILRSIYDKSENSGYKHTVGIVIAGEPNLMKMLNTYLPRYANRVKNKHPLNGLIRKEVEEYLDSYNFTKEALDEMVNRATNQKNGCFRLLDFTLDNIFKLLPRDAEITLDIIKQASRMMML